MKTKLFLLVTIVCLVFTACKKNTDPVLDCKPSICWSSSMITSIDAISSKATSAALDSISCCPWEQVYRMIDESSIFDSLGFDDCIVEYSIKEPGDEMVVVDGKGDTIKGTLTKGQLLVCPISLQLTSMDLMFLKIPYYSSRNMNMVISDEGKPIYIGREASVSRFQDVLALSGNDYAVWYMIQKYQLRAVFRTADYTTIAIRYEDDFSHYFMTNPEGIQIDSLGPGARFRMDIYGNWDYIP